MQKSLFFILLFFAGLPYMRAQDDETPVVEYSQGKIIGDLPYGRHFFIRGSTKMPNGAPDATKVRVKIWKTGRETFRRKKTLPLLEPGAISSIKSEALNLVNESDWDAYRADNTDQFKVYINTTLQFQKEYLVEFSYFQVFDFVLSDEEKDAILSLVVSKAGAYFSERQEITDVIVGNFLNSEITAVLKKKVSDAGFDDASDADPVSDNLPVITRSSLRDLSDVIGTVSVSLDIIRGFQADIQKQKQRIASAAGDASVIADAQNVIKSLELKIKRENDNIEAQSTLNEKLLVIKKQLIIGHKEYSLASSNAASVPDLKAIRIGTSFGGGALGLNVQNQQSREFDAFGYTALKFFFLPVDKRIAQPYMSDKAIINRMSFMIGFSTKKDFTYKGIALEKAFTVTPMLGLSYDISRFFSLDLGMTFFKQPSISPLSDKKNLRVGPVIGINLDADMFNRVSGLISGEKYKINPSN